MKLIQPAQAKGGSRQNKLSDKVRDIVEFWQFITKQLKINLPKNLDNIREKLRLNKKSKDILSRFYLDFIWFEICVKSG